MKLKDGATAILRLVHLDNLAIYLRRGALHSANHAPDDGLRWRAIHRSDVQRRRANHRVPIGPGGVLLDYVPFYFGARSPMLFQLHSGHVPGYIEGQSPLVYLVAAAEEVAAAGHHLVFYDGHALAALSTCYDDLRALGELDWKAIEARQWSSPEDLDLQRRKQAELLVHGALPWTLIRGVVAYDATSARRAAFFLPLAWMIHEKRSESLEGAQIQGAGRFGAEGAYTYGDVPNRFATQ